MKKLQELIKNTKCSVTITVNNHRDYYETIEQYIDTKKRKYISNDIWQKMIESDTCIELQVYPDTPIGFYVIYHYDIENAIDIALNED
tara:strand:- start:556 stop:819 length:264 start_codon:yes stop_codon:yes gene_type:complete